MSELQIDKAVEGLLELYSTRLENLVGKGIEQAVIWQILEDWDTHAMPVVKVMASCFTDSRDDDYDKIIERFTQARDEFVRFVILGSGAKD